MEAIVRPLDTTCRSLKHGSPAGPHADMLEHQAWPTGHVAPKDDAAQRDAKRRQFNATHSFGRPQGKGFE